MKKQEIAIFKETVDKALDSFLKEELKNFKSITNHQKILFLLEHIRAVSAGGKRLRPFLVFSLYKLTNKKSSPEDIIDLLLAIELFHVFCLVHDDVMDEANERHGVPTVQAEAFQKLYTDHPLGKKISESQAFLVGDMLFAVVFKLLCRFAKKHPDTGLEVFEVFLNLAEEVFLGQMIDVHLTSQSVANEQEINEKNKLKTAQYSFARPLQIGALVAKRKDLVRLALAFGKEVGLLYQIQDDLLDIVGDPKVTKKPRFQDIAQNQQTILSVFIEKKGGQYAKRLQELKGKKIRDREQADLEKIFHDSGAVEHAEDLIKKHCESAKAILDKHKLSSAEKEVFNFIIDLVDKREK